MSILTELLRGKITFTQAAAKAAGWAAGIASHTPALTAAAGELLSAVKQGASEAIGDADTALVAHLSPIVEAVETALEKALAGITGGLSVPFNPLIDAGIDRLAAITKQAAEVWALEAKGKIAARAAAPGEMTLSPQAPEKTPGVR